MRTDEEPLSAHGLAGALFITWFDLTIDAHD